MISITHENNEDLFLRLENESIDIICIDPPYKYLKNQKLEVDFDEKIFFENCKRVLTKDGFIIMFGRGSSFYRWNVILENLGFNFKEEIIWDKSHVTSPLMPINRVHETISLYSKGKGKINKVKIPYLEQKKNNIESIVTDIKRLKAVFKNTNSLNSVLNYLEKNNLDTSYSQGRSISISSNITLEDKCVSVIRSIKAGMNEKTILREIRNHYKSIHPTEKPVRLLERLIQLCLPKKDKIVISDFFGGSFSTMEAVINLSKTCPEVEFEGISCELDKEYFDVGKKRIDAVVKNIEKQQKLF